MDEFRLIGGPAGGMTGRFRDADRPAGILAGERCWHYDRRRWPGVDADGRATYRYSDHAMDVGCYTWRPDIAPTIGAD